MGVQGLIDVETQIRKPFRDRVFLGEHGSKPTGGDTLFTSSGSVIGHFEERPSKTDKTYTIWLLRDFYENLQMLPASESFKYLKLTFERLLDLRMYIRRQPRDDYERKMLVERIPRDPGCGYVGECPVDKSVLNAFVAAADRYFDESRMVAESIASATHTGPEDEIVWVTTREALTISELWKTDEIGGVLAWLNASGRSPCKKLPRRVNTDGHREHLADALVDLIADRLKKATKPEFHRILTDYEVNRWKQCIATSKSTVTVVSTSGTHQVKVSSK